MKRDYEVQCSINSGTYDKGDVITLEDGEAKDLLAQGVIKLCKSEEKPILSKASTKKTKG